MTTQMERYQQFIEEIAEQLPDLRGGVCVTHVNKGRSTAVNFCISADNTPRYFVKVYDAGAGGNVIGSLDDDQLAGLEIVADLSMEKGRRVMVTRWIEGRPLSGAADELQQMAALLERLHKTRVRKAGSGIWLELLRYRIYIWRNRVTFPHKREILAYLKRNRKQARNGKALTHMDMHRDNFMVDAEGKVHLLDFENLMVTDPWRDFVYAMTFHDPKENVAWYQVLQNYFRGQVPMEFWPTIRYYCFLQMLRMVICEHQKANQKQIDMIVDTVWNDYDGLCAVKPLWIKAMER